MSTTATFSMWMVALFRFLLIVTASSGIWMVQKSPLSAIPALKS
jgi:hypothetical protein